jgi:hypothetical protein
MTLRLGLTVLALLSAPAPAAPAQRSLGEDVADVATRVCYKVVSGALRWNPASLAEEEALLKSLDLRSGLPPGTIDNFGRNLAATFNQSILASRPNGASHVLLAIGGRMPGCRVVVSGRPGAVAAADVIAALKRPPYGWTPAPALGRSGGPIVRHSFVRRAENGATLLLDLLVVTEASGTFRLMAMVLPPPPGATLPPGF